MRGAAQTILLAVVLGGEAAAAAHGGRAMIVLPPLAAVAALLAQRRREIAGSALPVAAVVILIGLAVLPHFGVYRTVTVLSGSMRPTFGPGDVIVVTRERARDVRAGDVITYRIPVGDHHVETHRVANVLHGGDRPVVVTKGDANRAADPWTARLEAGPVWRYRFSVPFAGRVLMFMRAPLMHSLTVFLLPLLLAGVAVRAIWRPPVPDAQAA